jgi:hypothetical protein
MAASVTDRLREIEAIVRALEEWGGEARMTARDIFGLIVRLTGFALAVSGVLGIAAILCDLAIVSLGYPTSLSEPLHLGIAGTVGWGGSGLLIFLGAKRIVRLTYGPDHPN